MYKRTNNQASKHIQAMFLIQNLNLLNFIIVTCTAKAIQVEACPLFRYEASVFILQQHLRGGELVIEVECTLESLAPYTCCDRITGGLADQSIAGNVVVSIKEIGDELVNLPKVTVSKNTRSWRNSSDREMMRGAGKDNEKA